MADDPKPTQPAAPPDPPQPVLDEPLFDHPATAKKTREADGDVRFGRDQDEIRRGQKD